VSRLPPIPYSEWDLDALADAAPGMKPPPVNVIGLFAHHPELAKSFLAYNRHLTGRASTVDRRTRELVILRVAWRRRCRYEWAQHTLIAKRAGVTDEEIAPLRDGVAAPGSGTAASGTVQLLISAVDELLDDSGLSDETYEALAAELDARQLMDLVFTIGTYALLAMAFNSFGVELDPGVSADDFDAFHPARYPARPQPQKET
jgi:AhpD family alkylhydroperoxidase